MFREKLKGWLINHYAVAGEFTCRTNLFFNPFESNLPYARELSYNLTCLEGISISNFPRQLLPTGFAYIETLALACIRAFKPSVQTKPLNNIGVIEGKLLWGKDKILCLFISYLDKLAVYFIRHRFSLA